jgi:hypothetical protein
MLEKKKLLYFTQRIAVTFYGYMYTIGAFVYLLLDWALHLMGLKSNKLNRYLFCGVG